MADSSALSLLASSDASSDRGLKGKLSSDGTSDNEVKKHPSDASSDEESSGGSNDSEVKTDPNNASRNEDLSESFKGLKVSETTYGNETPQKKRDNNVASIEKGKRSLNVNTGTDKSTALSERKDGEWLKKHPWENETPWTTVDEAKVYPVPAEYLNSEGKVDLEKIYSNLPKFINEMKGPSIRQELEQVLQIDASRLNTNTKSTLLKAIDFEKVKPTPHVLEITRKQNKDSPEDQPSRCKDGKNNDLKAFSLPPQQNPHQPSKNNYWFLDCEYMLKMHLPGDSLQWFNYDDQQGKRIREITPQKKDKRWVFIPSFRRAKIALLEWPQDNIVTQESTIRILVVRPSEFDEYIACCGHLFPVICLPQDEIGAGYPRHWIQKIALRLGLQFIWMIDDSVECFYEYHPEQEPPEGSYSEYRRRKFGVVFQRIEHFVTEEADDSEKPIAAMSPRRWNPQSRPQKPFVCKPPQCAVYLNLRALSEKKVYYRPELKTFEDMIFGYECEQKGLKVYRDNRILLQDHDWKDTGASSPSVESK